MYLSYLDVATVKENTVSSPSLTTSPRPSHQCSRLAHKFQFSPSYLTGVLGQLHIDNLPIEIQFAAFCGFKTGSSVFISSRSANELFRLFPVKECSVIKNVSGIGFLSG